MTDPPDTKEPLRWIRASEWASENFQCDAHVDDAGVDTGMQCGRPVKWIIAMADGSGPLLGVCGKHKRLCDAKGPGR